MGLPSNWWYRADNSFLLAEAALYSLKRIYKPGYACSRGVCSGVLCPENLVPVDLFTGFDETGNTTRQSAHGHAR